MIGDHELSFQQYVRFEKAKAVLVKNFFPEKLLQEMQTLMERASFIPNEYEISDVGMVKEDVLAPKFVKLFLDLMNKEDVIRNVERITGVVGAASFNGRIYRLSPGTDHRMDWHQDIDQGKCLSVTVNIGASFDGGELLIRHIPTQEVFRFHNTGTGDAIFFEMHKDFEHCVLPVTGVNPKYGFTGWYHR
ncbi:MAG: 2OG-Fe(II) oxygenase [Bacteriovoracaceae bacterium]